MRNCSFCGNDVGSVDGCTEHKFVFGEDTDGTIRRDPDAADLVDPIAYGDEGDAAEETKGDCSICHVKPGRYHHPGCTVEECPNCGGKLVICDCNPHTLTREEPEP